jgi:signal transduction histidine kinase
MVDKNNGFFYLQHNKIGNPLRKRIHVFYAAALAVIFLAAGMIIESHPGIINNPGRAVRKFQKVLDRKEEKLNKLMDRIHHDADKGVDSQDYLNDMEVNGFLERNGFAMLLYQDDTLRAWTEKNIQVSDLFSESKLDKPLVFLGSAWFRTIPFELPGNRVIVGLILVKYKYAYQNEFINDRFQNMFGLPACVEIYQKPMEGGHVIENGTGDFLFSMVVPPADVCKLSKFPYAAGFYLFALFFLLLALRETLRIFRNRVHANWLVIFLGVVLLAINVLMFHFKKPSAIFELELFLPYNFALSNGCSSLGHLLITSLFIFYFSYIFYRDFDFQKWIGIGRPRTFYILFGLLSVLGSGFFVFNVYMFKSLILSSEIGFEPYKIQKLSYFSLLGYLSIVFLFFSVGLFFFKVISLGKHYPKRWHLLLAWIPGILVFPTMFFIQDPAFDLVSLAFYFILVVAVYRFAPRLPFIAMVIFSAIFGLYSTYISIGFSEKKEIGERQVVAVNLSAERDPVVEFLLENLGRKVRNDEVLSLMMGTDEFMTEDVDDIFNHIMSQYYKGYFEKYEVVMTLCSPYSDIYVEDINRGRCFDFFSTMIDSVGVPLNSTDFYFLDNGNDQISYFGYLLFPRLGDTLNNGLFLEFSSKPTYRQLGYPDLLLDQSLYTPGMDEEFSFARYRDGKLIQQSGDVNYSLSDDMFRSVPGEFGLIRSEGLNHVVYKASEDRTIVVSQNRLRLINLLISFSYLFVFLFFLSAIIYRLSLPLPLFKQRRRLLKNKIQRSMISILFFSLIFVGAGTVYFSINQYRMKQNENLREKIQSVYVELDHKLGAETELTSDWSADQYVNLDALLIKFSNVFFSDINLYDPSGNLLATSRPEIFDRGLIGYKMDYQAFRELSYRKQAEYVQEESIGSLDFLSAYVPFTNENNRLLAYLNLPYFTQQSILTGEVTNLVVGIVNFSTVMILIALVISVVISNQITNPLRQIQEKLGAIKLGRHSEPIIYRQKDEIGGLVEEYNRMIDELAKSAEILARSERETAWREMARQIAHEIKNPLTPMKLSIQHLKRAWKDGAKDWDAQLDKITGTLIEQIDNLSSIASAFSSFAEMPGTRNKKIDLVAIIHNRVSLFASNEDISFSLDLGDKENAFIYADENQFLRVFNNLIQNAIQSIPGDRKGLISIRLRSDRNMITVRLEDNGSGIPGDLGEKLFEPNFTTKSSGMGLGLAIVKRIIEDAGGRISYETEMGLGTTFILEIPRYQAGHS